MMVESRQFLKNILHQRLPRTKIRSLHLTVEEIEINTQNVKSVSVLMEFKCIFNDIVNAPRPHGPLLVELNPHQNVIYLIYVICYILISLKHHGIIIHFIIPMETMLLSQRSHNAHNIYLFKVNNRNTRTMCEIRSKLTMKSPERRHIVCCGCFYC